MPTINIRSIANYKPSEGADSATNPDAGKISDAALPRGALGRDLVPVTNAIRMMGRDIVKQVDQIRRGIDAVATPVSRSLATRGPAGAQGQARITGQRADRMQLQITVRNIGPQAATGGGGRMGGGGGRRPPGMSWEEWRRQKDEWYSARMGGRERDGWDDLLHRDTGGPWGARRWPRYRGRPYGGGMGPWGQRGGGMGRGGGGGRRGGGGGYGGGGAWNSGFGLGGVGRGAIEVGVLGLLAREIGELVEFVANPLRPVTTLEKEKLGLAKPYMDLSNSMYGLARAGRFGGAGLLGNVLPSLQTGGQPAWMQGMNLGPEQAGQLLTGYGYAPSGSHDQTELLKTLAFHENVAGGFAGMAPGSAVGAAALARGTGAIQPGGEDRYLSSLNRILEDSFAKGMDRSRILDSMNSSLELMKNAGAMPGSDATTLMEMMRNSGTMAGRTGDLGLAAVQGFGNISSGIGSSPVVSMAYMKGLTGAKTPDDLGKVYGYSSAEMAEKMKNPMFAQTVNSMLGMIGSGNVGMAAMLGSPILGAGKPLAQAKMLKGQLDSMGLTDPLIQGAMIGNASGGGTLNQQTGMIYSMGGKGAVLSTGITGNLTRDQMIKAGVPEAYVDTVISAANQHNINPMTLAAIIDKESNWDPNARNGSHLGMGQLGGPERASLGVTNPFDPTSNINASAALLEQKTNAAGGDMLTGIKNYGTDTPAYVTDVINRVQRMQEMAGTPPTFGPQSSVDTLSMVTSKQDFYAFVQIIPAINTELAHFLTSVKGVADGLDKLKGQLPGGSMQQSDVGNGGAGGMLQGFINGTMQ